MMDTTYNVGIYCRLSNDDERDGESVSIENQKLLLQNYVRQRGWNEVDVYIDDGYSGTNFAGVRQRTIFYGYAILPQQSSSRYSRHQPTRGC